MKGAVLPFESVDEILWCDHSKATEQYLLVVLFIVQGCSTFPFAREKILFRALLWFCQVL